MPNYQDGKRPSDITWEPVPGGYTASWQGVSLHIAPTGGSGTPAADWRWSVTRGSLVLASGTAADRHDAATQALDAAHTASGPR